jgi:acyl carrier protein
MKSNNQLRAEIRQFVIDELLLGDAAGMLPDAASLSEAGIVNSTGVLEVLMFLEQHFELSVADRELVPDNFDSVDKLVDFVARKTNAD